MMLILLFCMFTLSSAFVNDLDEILGQLGCKPDNLLPLTNIDPLNTVATELSKYCSSYTEIADCIEESVNEDSLDPVVWNFAKKFDKNVMIRKSVDVCSRIHESDLASDLNCVENIKEQSCRSDWINELYDVANSASRGDADSRLCVAASSFKSCVQISFKDVCSFQAARFMEDYASVLSGFTEECELVVTSVDSSSPFGLPADVFTLEGSALLECAKTAIVQITDIYNPNNMLNIGSVANNLFEIVCGQKDKIVSCLKENMPGSNSVIDQIILLFVDLDGAGKVLDNYCSKRNLVAENIECLIRNTTSVELLRCAKSFNFDSGILNQGFAFVDYMCSAIVNSSECSSKVIAQHCSSELGDLVSSTNNNLLTPECRKATPRPVVEVMQAGWSYTIAPRGIIAMECILPIAVELMPFFNDTAGSSGVFDFQSLIRNVLGHICKRADSVLTCLETKLPGGTSKIDGLTREVIDLQKLRVVKTSVCQNQNEIVTLFPCFFNDSSIMSAQTDCIEGISNTFMQSMGNMTAFSLILPGTIEGIKALICGDNSAFSQWANCQANAVKGCSSRLSEYVLQVLTGALRDNCENGSEDGDGQDGDSEDGDGQDDDCVGAKCGASSVVVHSILWLLVGAVGLRYM